MADSLRGKLLLASPTLLDPNFVRTVVLIAEHTEEGAMGLVLNRPAASTVFEAVPDLAWLTGEDEQVYVGGPVAETAVIVLAEFDRPDVAGALVEDDLGFIGTDADDPDAAGGRDPPRPRVRRPRRLGAGPARGRARGRGLDHRAAAARGDLQRGRARAVGGGAAAQGPQVRAAVHDAARPLAELIRRSLLLGAVLALVAAAPAPAANRWLGDKVLNMAHQGGEDELPSNTMYAFRKAMRLGADRLELDVGPTKDGPLVVMHDWQVDRTTNGTGYLTDLTLAAGPASSTAPTTSCPAATRSPACRRRAYPFRGVRTGAKQAARRASRRNDFRVPTLAEVLRAFPHTPINIEIKGRDDDRRRSSPHNADLLAALLKDTKRRDLIVVSFNQPAVDRFHALVPQVDVAPGVDGIAGFLLGGALARPGRRGAADPDHVRARGQTLQVTTPENVLQTHRAGYAVHVWLSNDEENARVYDRLLNMCVDGIMAAKPKLLERRCAGAASCAPAGTAPTRARCGRAGPRSSSARWRSRWSGAAPGRRPTRARCGSRAGRKLLGRETFSARRRTRTPAA